MEETQSLKRWLTDLTATYHEESAKVPVQFSDPSTGSYAATDGEHIGIVVDTASVYGQNNLLEDLPEEVRAQLPPELLEEAETAPELSRADELRIVTDTTSHEVEHVNKSILTAKGEFMDEWPEASEVAGMVHNILEDQYIDRTRVDRFLGLRKAHAFKIDHIMANDLLRPPVDQLPRGAAFVEGFLQVAFSGTAKGIEDAEEDLREFLAWAEPRIDAARFNDDPEDRTEIARRVMAKLMEYIPEQEARKEANDYANSSADGNTTDKTGDSNHNPEDYDKEDIEEHLKSLSKEDVENMEAPEDPSDGVEVDLDELDVDEDELDFDLEDLPSAPGDGSGGGEEAEEDAESGGGDEEDQEDGDGSAGEEDAEEGREEDGDGEGEDGDGEEEDGEGEDGPTGEEGPSTGTASNTGQGGLGGEADLDPIPGKLDEMEKRADGGIESGEWWGLTGDVEYSEAGEEWERRAAELERREAELETDLGQRKAQRDERMGDARGDSAADTRAHMRDTGLAQEIVDAFRRLRTRDVEVPVRAGDEIHIDNAIRHLSGDYSVEEVYKRRQRIEVGDRAVQVVVDMSGSMSTHAVRVALASLHLATHEIGDKMAATGFEGNNNTPLIKAFDEHWEWSMLNAVVAGGSTPMPAGIEDGLDMLTNVQNRERCMIVVTDGRANTSLRPGGDAREEAAALVGQAHIEGVKVIGLGVSHVDEGYMASIFGADGFVMADEEHLAEALVWIYRRQMDLVKEVR